MLSSPIIISLTTAACLTPSCFAAERYAGVLERLSRTPPPARQSLELKARVIASLPKDGEVTVLPVEERDKLESLQPVLRAHGREGEYLFKVVASNQARLGLHARFVILISHAALKVLTRSQLQAVVAHEIGHDYTWDEYQAAQKRSDWARIRELELYCDGLAAITLVRMGIKPSTLIDALRILAASDQANGITFDPNGNSHPSISERTHFGEEIAKWLAGNVCASSAGPFTLQDRTQKGRL